MNLLLFTKQRHGAARALSGFLVGRGAHKRKEANFVLREPAHTHTLALCSPVFISPQPVACTRAAFLIVSNLINANGTRDLSPLIPSPYRRFFSPPVLYYVKICAPSNPSDIIISIPPRLPYNCLQLLLCVLIPEKCARSLLLGRDFRTLLPRRRRAEAKNEAARADDFRGYHGPHAL